MTLGSSNIYWEESIHTEGKSDRKQEGLPTLQHQQVVNWVSECELRSQNMKKLLAAMSSFEVSVKSVESTIYSTSLIFTRASWLEWWKWLQKLMKQVLTYLSGSEIWHCSTPATAVTLVFDWMMLESWEKLISVNTTLAVAPLSWSNSQWYHGTIIELK